jgi:hypothetical protein
MNSHKAMSLFRIQDNGPYPRRMRIREEEREGQLFRLVLVIKAEITCLTFLLLHFGQIALVALCSAILDINENFFLQSWHSYS